MSRNSSGTYSLPAGNPVVSGTVISSSWANSTLSDIATALTDSLSRSGDGGMTAPLLLPDGAVGLPALAFTNQPDTGFYLAAAGDMRGSVDAVAVFQLLAQGAGVANGAAATPGLFFISDPNTGLYRIGADNLGFSTAGTLRGDVNSTGNWTLAAPSSGATLALAQVSGGISWQANAASTSDRTYALLNNSAGTRRLEFIAVGSAASAVYGIPADQSGINGINGLNLCAADTRYLTISTAGDIAVWSTASATLEPVGNLRLIPQTFTTSRSATAADRGAIIRGTTTGGQTFTLPTTGFSPGDTITFCVDLGGFSLACAGVLRWMSGGGTYTDGSPRTIATGATVTCSSIDGTNWFVWGSGIS